MEAEIISTIVGLCALFGLVAYRHYRERRLEHRLGQVWEAGEAAYQARRLEEAELAFAEAVKLHGLWPAPRQRLAQVHALQGKLQQAEQELQFASALRPREPEGPFGLAAFYAQHCPDRRSDVLRCLREALRLDPRGAELLREHRHFFTALENDPEFQALAREAGLQVPIQ